MDFEFIKEFAKTKKAKAMIAAAVGAALLHFFPGSADTIAQWSDTAAEILTGVSDKVHPDAAAALNPQ